MPAAPPSTSIRALHFRGLRTAPAPTPAPGEVLIRTTLIGLGSADVAILQNRLPFDGLMGREWVGTVERVGAGVDASWISKRVTGAACIPCGDCPLCRGGLSGACPQRIFPGARGRDGCAAQLAAFPANHLHEVPRALSDEDALLAHSLAAATACIQAARLTATGFVTVLGDGAIALLAARTARAANPNVRLLGLHPSAMSLCDRWGIKSRPLRDAGRRRDQSIVIDCTNSPDGLAAAAEQVCPRGTISRWSGSPVPIATADPAAAIAAALRDEARILGASAVALGPALAALAAKRADTTGLITRKFSLEDAAAALSAAAEPGAVKIVIAI